MIYSSSTIIPVYPVISISRKLQLAEVHDDAFTRLHPVRSVFRMVRVPPIAPAGFLQVRADILSSFDCQKPFFLVRDKKCPTATEFFPFNHKFTESNHRYEIPYLGIEQNSASIKEPVPLVVIPLIPALSPNRTVNQVIP